MVLTNLQASTSRQGRLDPSITHASYLAKPQLKFNRKVDNTNDFVWAPKLKHKYNAQVPLGYALRDVPATNEEKASEGCVIPFVILWSSMNVRVFYSEDSPTRIDTKSSIYRIRDACLNIAMQYHLNRLRRRRSPGLTPGEHWMQCSTSYGLRR